MATTTLAEGRTFIRTGKSLTSLYKITEGSVSASRKGEEFLLQTGDIIGICELHSATHLFSYKTLETCTLESYPYAGSEDFPALFKQDPVFAKSCLVSSFRHTQLLYEQYYSALDEAASMYQSCLDDEAEYLSLCRKYHLEPLRLPALDTLVPFIESTPPEDWYPEYLKGFQRILNAALDNFAKEPEVLTGILIQNARDCQRIFAMSDTISDYLFRIYELYISEEQTGFFGLYTSVLSSIGLHAEDSDKLKKHLERIILQAEKSLYCDPSLLHQKAGEYQKLISPAPQNTGQIEDSVDFSDSLSTILSFSSFDKDTKDLFSEKLYIYRELKDRSSTEEPVARLRNELTTLFYKLYESVVLNSLKYEELPIPVMMFLYFGYLDETIAGREYTGLLYQCYKRLSEQKHNGIYTLYDWLLAIYQGKKEPSRNSFDEDYTDCLHARRVGGKITEQEEKELLQNQKQKLLFELQNMFPNVNKMTYGRISTYCPVFSEHNLFKSPSSAFVTADAVYKILGLITRADFQAFYRETVFTGDNCGVAKEYIHVNCPPDIILMPCAGTRGVMWQEIEGKKRTTPARFMLPVFQMEDLTSCLIHMVGEYRWEICKRIQGGRWNDVTERSLTSEYFDYLQFYKKNQDFSPETKDKIKSSLIKAKNNFKEMFARDYVTWVLYESTGSPRLNKVARGILLTYCPFSSSVRNELLGNPIFKDSIERYNLKNKQKLHRMDNLFVKIKNSGHPVPFELKREYDFLNM